MMYSACKLNKHLPANAGNTGSILASERSQGEGNGDALQYSCLGNSMDRGAWWARVYWITKELGTTYQQNNNLLHIHLCKKTKP